MLTISYVCKRLECPSHLHYRNFPLKAFLVPSGHVLCTASVIWDGTHNLSRVILNDEVEEGIDVFCTRHDSNSNVLYKS